MANQQQINNSIAALNKDDKEVKEALAELEKKCLFLKILGSYPVGR